MPEHTSQQQNRKYQILIVDDDTAVGETFKRILGRSGFEVQTAANYKEAARLLSTAEFDAAVVDICLGDADGLELLAESRESHPDTPVILVTGFPTVETASAAVRLDAYEYLTKPIPSRSLTQTVTRAAEHKALRDAKRRVEIENRNYQKDLEKLVAARTAKLIQSHERYQLLFENSRDAIYMAAWDGRFLALNQAMVQLFGYDRDALIRSGAISLYVDRAMHDHFQEEIRRLGFVKDFDVRFRKKDGSIIDCLLTAHLLTNADDRSDGYQGIIRDITSKKLAEKKIRLQNTFLTNVIESLAHPFLVIDARDYSVKIANAAARRNRTGRGETCHSLNHCQSEPCSRKGTQCPVEEVVASGRPVHMEHIHTDDNGDLREHAVHAFPLSDQQGRVIQVIQYCIDITEKKRLEAVAEAANLMDNLGYIFSGIRHEIGNPLNSVKMALSVLSMNLDHYPRETIREFVDRSLGEVSRVEYLLKALKNFSMYETPEVEPVGLKGFLHTFLSLVDKDFTAKNIRIAVELPADEIEVRTDHRAFHQVLLNLLTNAADALKDIPDPEIRIAAVRVRPFVQVQVIDNGCGMNKSELQNLFRPFFTSKRHGTGLGLMIVKKMLAKMNSTIRIESQVGQGTTVTMTLPEGAQGQNVAS